MIVLPDERLREAGWRVHYSRRLGRGSKIFEIFALRRGFDQRLAVNNVKNIEKKTMLAEWAMLETYKDGLIAPGFFRSRNMARLTLFVDAPAFRSAMEK